MNGTVAITDPRWYEELRHGEFDEVNFWKPSARQTFRAPEFSPFFFKLPKPHYAICGFGFFAQYTPLPIWLAWDTFERANGCRSLAELEARWVTQPEDWPLHGQRPKKWDLEKGEGERIWNECLATARELSPPRVLGRATEEGDRYGEPILTRQRLGQKTFRIAVTEAYGRACALTGEHSLPALDAAHIKLFASGGPNTLSNGILLRADLHRLFDWGYITITRQLKVRVSARLREEYQNGRTYYPLDGTDLRRPLVPTALPDPDLLDWHNAEVFAA